MQRSPSARAEATDLLQAFLKDGSFADRAQPLGLCRELVHGSMRWFRHLEAVESAYCRRQPERWTRALLLSGFYEILHTSGADHAAVSERVELAKTKRKQAVSRMVNACLRRCVRERDQWHETFAKAELGLRLSHPDELLTRWSTWMEAGQLESVCTWNQTPPRTWARLRDPSLVETWRAAGLSVSPHPTLSSFVALKRPGAIPALPGFSEGLFYIQDPSTCFAPALLNARPGERVLDACAAPGGKTIVLAESMQGTGTLVAADRHDDRLPRLRENLERMRAEWVELRHEDATSPARSEERFDAILLDVPCSNSGVLARRPEARWRITPRRLHELQSLQGRLLDASWERLAPGGRMVYSTCSIEPAETREVIDAFLARQPNARSGDPCLTLPGEDECDGAFAVVIHSAGERRS